MIIGIPRGGRARCTGVNCYSEPIKTTLSAIRLTPVSGGITSGAGHGQKWEDTELNFPRTFRILCPFITCV